MKDIDDLFEDIHENIDKKKEGYKSLVLSSKYVQAKGYLDSVKSDFILALQCSGFYSTREPESKNKLLFARGIEEFLESIVAISLSIKEGALNPPRRELRYMLEMAVKYLFVDINLSDSPFEDRIKFLNNHVPKSSIEPVDSLKLYGLTFEDKKNFTDDVHALYANLCRFVHPSKYQIDEYMNRVKRGATLGFETDKELVVLGALLFRVLDIVIFLIFQGLGIAATGDLFIHVFDDKPKWKLHKGRYCRLVSAIYDYKLERQQKNNIE